MVSRFTIHTEGLLGALADSGDPMVTPSVSSDRSALSKKHGGSPPDPGNGASPGRSLQQTEIGFIGLGHMGSAMAANLAAAGYRVMAYVRRPDQMDTLAALGLK